MEFKIGKTEVILVVDTTFHFTMIHQQVGLTLFVVGLKKLLFLLSFRSKTFYNTINKKTMSKELLAFKKHFQENCSIKVEMTIEDKSYFHWKRLVFHSLNCEQMNEVSWYIRKTFSKEENYSHLLPKLGVHNGFLCLTVDVIQIKEKIMGEI
jgi:hypothetical protein